MLLNRREKMSKKFVVAYYEPSIAEVFWSNAGWGSLESAEIFIGKTKEEIEEFYDFPADGIVIELPESK
jgi:hypothetical protein